MTTKDADIWLAWGLKRIAAGAVIVAVVLLALWGGAWIVYGPGLAQRYEAAQRMP